MANTIVALDLKSYQNHLLYFSYRHLLFVVARLAD